MIDTNVLAVAEGMHEGATEACVLACVRVIRCVLDGQRLGVDSGDEILSEYVSVMQGASSAGLGTKLAKRLYRQRYDDRLCHLVDITPIAAPPGSYDEVPPALRNFDADDQKFLAVAAAEGGTPPIYQALDTEWWHRRPDFAANGLDVQFPCSTDLAVI